MKKYLSGSFAVLKYYFFVMIFFYVFIVGFSSVAAYFSIATFIILIPLIYYEMANYTGFDKRRFGRVRPYEGAIYGLLAIAPLVIIQIVLFLTAPHFDLSFISADIKYDKLRLSLVKLFVAPMLFIPKIAGYTSIWGYAAAWLTIVLSAFLGYFSGYKGFDLGAFIRGILGLQPKKDNKNKRNRRFK
ncbi:hypothetical protein LY28_01708 [Ruminiclostridium sufflavum DSM 19573]|uniref:Uncharacterized protein n=1 Tax=Ruminiclostridium sufflavum DSM 19573 TaxID=1121337 RepID=A0A318XMS6_9FIRM|nr:hypothetical protein [Ruminiclostridium sufflavum]PYG87998.1 hypothetical protein LY28_01708 [Ruminiclostridium sufflavum DSM 19573]